MTLLESIPEFQDGWAQATPTVGAEEGIIESMRDATGLVLVY